jgi:hypothetical protein
MTKVEWAHGMTRDVIRRTEWTRRLQSIVDDMMPGEPDEVVARKVADHLARLSGANLGASAVVQTMAAPPTRTTPPTRTEIPMADVMLDADAQKRKAMWRDRMKALVAKLGSADEDETVEALAAGCEEYGQCAAAGWGEVFVVDTITQF